EFLVVSTGEMLGRMVRSGLVGCPVCHREYRLSKGVVDFGGGARREGEGAQRPSPGSRLPSPEEAQTLQALLDLSGPGGFVVLLGSAARHAVSLSALMGGIHFVGVNGPPDAEELPVLSLLRGPQTVPLRGSMARGVVVGAELATAPWLGEAVRVLLRGRRLVVEGEKIPAPEGIKRLASGEGLFVGEKQ
ncbi:MAG: hypothetical protein ACREMV_10645, partial [Gemmatimonadales bacterium]